MNIIYFLAPMALLLSGFFMFAFLWATKTGQWDDLDLTPRKILDEQPTKKDNHEQAD